MNILVIDTATPIEIVAALSEKLASDQAREISISHSCTLFKSIDLALKETGIEMKDLDVIGVGIGPGSFTGIRIAVTTARMFSHLFNLPIIGIKTHLIYASSAVNKANPNENILIAFDAKKNRVFGALYRKNEDTLNPVEIVKPGDYTIEHIISHVNIKEKALLIGDGCEKYYNEIKSKISHYNILYKYKPSGDDICNLVKKIYIENPDKYRDFNTILPFYSRKSDAEIMKKYKKNNTLV